MECDKQITEKRTQIAEQKQKLEQLTQQSELIEKKMKQMKKFENFLKKVQEKNSDEFLELKDIVERFRRL